MLKEKIKGRKTLARIVSGLKAKGKKVVFTNGCFDILHYGHVKYLEEARAKGDILVLGLNSDASVRRIKGAKRPLVTEKDRARIVAALESVDYVTVFNEDTPYSLIRTLCPDVLVKGGDWKKYKIVGSDIVSGYGGKVVTIKFVKGCSTSGLIEKIAERY